MQFETKSKSQCGSVGCESVSCESFVHKYRCDKEIKASDDLYMHVNKEWLESPENRIPGDYEKWGGFIKLYDMGLQNQIKLARDLCDKLDKTDEEKKIVAVWQACENKFKSWKEKTATYDPIVRELEILDAYFSFSKPIEDVSDFMNRLAEYLYYSQVNGISNVFDFDSGSDLTNSNNFVLDFGTSGTSLPSREYYLDDKFSEKRVMFKNHLENVSKMIMENSTIDLGEDFVENVYSFEVDLAKVKMTPAQSRKFDEYFTNTTLSDFHKNINEMSSLPEKQLNYAEEKRDFRLTDDQVKMFVMFMERLYELFDFRKVLSDNLRRTFVEKKIESPPNPEHISVFDGDAVRRIFDIISNKDNLRRYYSFLQYKIITAYKSYCTEEIDKEYFDFYSRKLTGQLEQKPEDKRSIQIVNSFAGEMFGKVYVSRYFPEACKQEVKMSINEILEVMKDSIESNDWLTPLTKKKALEKLSKFTIKIGYPDVWKDYKEFDIKEGDSLYDISKKAKTWSMKIEFFPKLNTPLDRTEWLMTPQTVNAYYMPTQNEIVFPAAILQPPFYCKSKDEIDFDITDEIESMRQIDDYKMRDYDFTQSSNYGGICAVIAHEITHGFDDDGRKFNGDGNLEDWWTEDDVKLFSSKVDLINEQASTYTFVDPDDSNKVYHMDPKLTTGENLADLGGISLSLKALTKGLKRKNSSEHEIRANQRVLFKSFANIWKQNAKKDTKINLLTTDTHAPTDFRGNLVKNVDEFYNVFNVKETDPMFIASAKRVRMW